jgi:uncharacterized protein (TIGR02444 family)
VSDFWDWAVRAYGRPGAAEACLALQDDSGQNVPLMLWVVWRARTGSEPDGAALAAAADLAQRWEDAVVGPLRRVRRDLRSPLPGPSEGEREAFRLRVKGVELEAERLLMSALEALDGDSAEPCGEAGLLSRAAEAYGRPTPPEAFADLLARL